MNFAVTPPSPNLSRCFVRFVRQPSAAISFFEAGPYVNNPPGIVEHGQLGARLAFSYAGSPPLFAFHGPIDEVPIVWRSGPIEDTEDTISAFSTDVVPISYVQLSRAVGVLPRY